MVRFKDVTVDPWLQHQEDYEGYKEIPDEAEFACAYYIQTSPFTDGIEAVFFRRIKDKDELWAATWDVEFDGSLADYSKRGQYDSFGCKVTAPRAGDAVSACRRLLSHLFRSRYGYMGLSHFEQKGILTEDEYQGIRDGLKYEQAQYTRAARANKSAIVNTAEELGLLPEPTGEGPYSWSANCPGTSHRLFISTKSDTFGCGYCRRKGGSDELYAFVKERRSKR